MKLPRIIARYLIGASVLLVAPDAAWSQERIVGSVEAAQVVLREFTSLGVQQIPESLLRDAQGIAIVPNVLKIGFVAGVRHGRGVVLVRDEHGSWQLPTLIELTGGSVGWQAGAQSTDVILVFRSRRGLENLLRGTVTLGADAAVAAGPVGRQVQAATDTELKAEILSYSRSRGLFAGLALDGSVLKPDYAAQAAFYGSDASGMPTRVPDSAVQLTQMIAQATGSAPAASPLGVVAGNSLPAGPQASAEQVHAELAQATQRLAAILDADWRRFLELSPDLLRSAMPDLSTLPDAIRRFDRVAADPKYQALTQRREFQDAHRLLRLLASLSQTQGRHVELPPPPR